MALWRDSRVTSNPAHCTVIGVKLIETPRIEPYDHLGAGRPDKSHDLEHEFVTSLESAIGCVQEVDVANSQYRRCLALLRAPRLAGLGGPQIGRGPLAPSMPTTRVTVAEAPVHPATVPPHKNSQSSACATTTSAELTCRSSPVPGIWGMLLTNSHRVSGERLAGPYTCIPISHHSVPPLRERNQAAVRATLRRAEAET